MEEDIIGSDVERSTMCRSDNGGFDCNICLQSVHEPVTTLCGHIYCWPCIYKWLHIQKQQETCPVCKTDISLTSLVPLYVHTGTSNNSDSEAKRLLLLHMGVEIPPRPPPPPPPYNMNAVFTSSANIASRQQLLHQSPISVPHFREVYANTTADMFFTESDTNVDAAADSHGRLGNGSGSRGMGWLKMMQIDRRSLNRFILFHCVNCLLVCILVDACFRRIIKR